MGTPWKIATDKRTEIKHHHGHTGDWEEEPLSHVEPFNIFCLDPELGRELTQSHRHFWRVTMVAQ